MAEEINTKSWFSNTLESLFEPDDYGRVSSQQIASVFNCYYSGLGLPDLSTNAIEVGRWLAKYNDIGFTLSGAKRKYHLRLKAGLDLPADLVVEIDDSRIKSRARPRNLTLAAS